MSPAPAETKPVLEAVLARWYWHYFQANRGRFLQRTQTAGAPGPDFLTWDLARILAEIDRRFTAALAGEAILKATPISAYDDLLEKGTVPDAYRPTLYDFLAQEALAFYQIGEQAAVRSEDTFELEPDSPIFADATEFSRWKPESTDTNSPILKAVALYQKLLDFHRNDADKSAYYDANLAREFNNVEQRPLAARSGEKRTGGWVARLFFGSGRAATPQRRQRNSSSVGSVGSNSSSRVRCAGSASSIVRVRRTGSRSRPCTAR